MSGDILLEGVAVANGVSMGRSNTGPPPRGSVGTAAAAFDEGRRSLSEADIVARSEGGPCRREVAFSGDNPMARTVLRWLLRWLARSLTLSKPPFRADGAEEDRTERRRM